MFFEPWPDPDPETAQSAPEVYYSSPDREPQNWIPGPVAIAVPLARTSTTSLVLSGGACYPGGISLSLDARFSPDDLLDDSSFSRHPGRREAFVAGLRVGMRWADGSEIETENPWRRNLPAEPARFRLNVAGGGGGGISFNWLLWLWPLPPAEPVDVVCVWPSRGIPETSTSVDLSPAVLAAGAARELWPLPSHPNEGGWFAYSPPNP